MKSSTRPLRALSKLPEFLENDLKAYALAARAAGVGLLATAMPAAAKIVYTPVYVPIGKYHLDLNHDKITDFVLAQVFEFCHTSCLSDVLVYSAPASNRFVGTLTASSRRMATPLRPGQKIGPRAQWQNPYGIIEFQVAQWNTSQQKWSNKIFGPWANNGKGFCNRYLGLEFLINGKPHYGWARLNSTNPVRLLLTGYAYETIPGKAIVAGAESGLDDPAAPLPAAPGSLGGLARGRR